jgi:hypothetical protein
MRTSSTLPLCFFSDLMLVLSLLCCFDGALSVGGSSSCYNSMPYTQSSTRGRIQDACTTVRVPKAKRQARWTGHRLRRPCCVGLRARASRLNFLVAGDCHRTPSLFCFLERSSMPLQYLKREMCDHISGSAPSYLGSLYSKS